MGNPPEFEKLPDDQLRDAAGRVASYNFKPGYKIDTTPKKKKMKTQAGEYRTGEVGRYSKICSYDGKGSKNYDITATNVPGEVWNKDLMIDEAAMPDIRSVHDEMEDRGDLNWSGCEAECGAADHPKEFTTLLEKAKKGESLEELATLAACTVKQRKNVFDHIEEEISTLADVIYNMDTKLSNLRSLLKKVKELIIIE